MESSSDHNKYVHINRRTSAIELDLPSHLSKYSAELREKITKDFAFASINHALEDKIQIYIEEFFKEKGEI